MQPTQSAVYTFGEFRLEPGERLLTRRGEVIALAPKVFDTLVALVEAEGRLVDKQTLMQRLWPETFVEEVNLARNVSLLRKALGDADGQTYVETVPKSGYRFAAGVVRSAAGSDLTPLASASRADARLQRFDEAYTVLPAARRLRRIRASAGLIAAACLIVASLVIHRYRSHVFNPSPAVVRSVAVLPFRPLVFDPNDEYLGLALADTVVTQVAKLTSLVPRSSVAVRKYATELVDPVVAGRELQVDAVVDGTIQRSADRIRVTARLTRVVDGVVLWADHFDESYTDMLRVQDSIAQRTASALLPQLAGWGQAVPTRETSNAAAYEAYLKARYFFTKRSGAWQQKALEYFEAAVRADPQYARAYAGLAEAYVLAGSYDGPLAVQNVIPKAKAAARRAGELDRSLAEVHTTLAIIAENYDWDWPEAERQYKQAIALNPNDARAHECYGEYLSFFGRFDEALVELARAVALDPVSPAIRRDTALVLRHARRPEQAIGALREALELEPGYTSARASLVWFYIAERHLAEAEAELTRYPAVNESDRIVLFGALAAASGRLDEARASIDRLLSLSTRQNVSPWTIASLYQALGDSEHALDWLERAVEVRDTALTSLKVNPDYDSVRTSPRFLAILRRLHLDG